MASAGRALILIAASWALCAQGRLQVGQVPTRVFEMAQDGTQKLTHLRDRAQLAVLDHHQKENNCECLPWQAAYAVGTGGKVGAAAELYSYSKGSDFSDSDMSKAQAIKSTRDVFKSQKYNYCVKMDNSATIMAEEEVDKRSWCYVSRSCSKKELGGTKRNLHGGTVVSGALAWKICEAGKDKSLGDLAPAELFAVLADQKSPYQKTARFAYPAYSRMTYHEAMEYTKDAKKHGIPDTAIVQHKQDLMYVVKGEQVWKLDKEAPPMCIKNCP